MAEGLTENMAKNIDIHKGEGLLPGESSFQLLYVASFMRAWLEAELKSSLVAGRSGHYLSSILSTFHNQGSVLKVHFQQTQNHDSVRVAGRKVREHSP